MSYRDSARTRSVRDEDYIKEAVEYLKRNVAKGYSLEALKWALINQGKSRVLVEKAVEAVKKELQEQEEIKALQSKPVQAEVVKIIKAEEQTQETEQPKKKNFLARIFG